MGGERVANPTLIRSSILKAALDTSAGHFFATHVSDAHGAHTSTPLAGKNIRVRGYLESAIRHAVTQEAESESVLTDGQASPIPVWVYSCAECQKQDQNLARHYVLLHSPA
jgi:hypothetical protein